MNINVNEIVSNLTKELSKNRQWIYLLIIAVLAFVYITINPLSQWGIKREERLEKEQIIRLEAENQYINKLDSIRVESETLRSQLFIYKNNEINNLMVYLERRLPESSHITVFSVHNGGGVPKTGGEAKISALYTTDNVRGVDILQDYGNYQLYPGYAEYCKMMLSTEGDLVYIPDLNNYSAIYSDKTKENMDLLKTKSIAGVYIKAGPTATFYISVSFDEINGADISGMNNLKSAIEYARNKLITLLDAK